MSDFKQKAINRYIEMNHTFLYLLKQGDFDQEKINLMTQNHHMMRSALIDLGVEFSEVKRIQQLNEKIREMEKSSQSIDMDYQKVSLYINNINEQIKNALEKHGVYCIVTTSFSPDISVSINILSSSEKESYTFYRNEEEFKAQFEKNKQRHLKLTQNFTLVERENNGNMQILFDPENIDKLVKIVEESLGLKSSQFKYDLQCHYAKVNESSNNLISPTLSSVDITFLTLASHQSFAAAMAERYN